MKERIKTQYMGRINPMNGYNSPVRRGQKFILIIFKKLKTDKFKGLPSIKKLIITPDQL